jgi:oligogalacturonide lyase
VCSSSRAGKLDAWRVDFRSGAWRRLTDASNLDPNSVALTPDERTLCFIDGTSARAVTQSNLKERELYHTGIEGAALTSLTLHPEGNQVFLVEQRGDVSRVIALSLAHGSPSELLTAGGRIERVLPRPGRGFAYRIEDRVYLSGTSTRGTGAPAPLALAPGRTGPVFWSPDGASLLYLNIPDKAGQLHTIREYVVATGEDRLVAKTTQFVEFVPNADASVFLGASGSKASPHVLLLVRNVRRELTLCEHRAKNPSSLAVAFSPNSQRVVYQSDEHGSPAIYTLAVERFVAETES